MKIFILAVAVMVLTGAFVLWSGWYVGRVCGELIALLDRFPAEVGELAVFGDTYHAFEKRWRGSALWIGGIVGDKAVAEVERQIEVVGFCYLVGDAVGYGEGLTLLRALLQEVWEGERVSLERIL